MSQASHGGGSALRDMLGDEAIAAVRRPTGEARGLPNSAYTSEEFYALEQKLLFARTWTCAGYGHQIPRPGDILPVTVAGYPLILVRDRDGGINAFHNVCRHRGALLVAEPAKGARVIRCPYHAWCYRLDGQLDQRPHFRGPGKHDADGAGLHPVRSESWLDAVFVNLDGEAPPLTQHLKPVLDRLAGYDLSAMRYSGTLTFDLDTNWKLALENYIEPYHLSAVHPALQAATPMSTYDLSHDGPCMIGTAPIASRQVGWGEGLPAFPHTSERALNRLLYFVLFPSLGFGLTPDRFNFFQVIPDGPHRTREVIHLYFADAAMAAEYAPVRQGALEAWDALNNEDIWIVERLHQGRTSPAFDGGTLSPYWDTVTHHFARLVVDTMS